MFKSIEEFNSVIYKVISNVIENKDMFTGIEITEIDQDDVIQHLVENDLVRDIKIIQTLGGNQYQVRNLRPSPNGLIFINDYADLQ